MPKSRIRLLSSIAAAFAVWLAAVVPTTAAHAHDATTFTFSGGGWGHGVGMSQYGALARAQAGHGHGDILAFYYHGTRLMTAPELVPDDVDVRIAVHNQTVFKPTGVLTVAIDGSFLDTTSNTLTVRRGNGGWYINSSNIDWCRGFCNGTVLTVSFNDRQPVEVSNTANGTRRYGHGQFQLTPARAGLANCGEASSNQYCLVVGDMSMQRYLHGLGEMPASWPVEALKAQAIAGRSYAVSKIRDNQNWGEPFDLYTSTLDQEYRGWDRESATHPLRQWADAVDATNDTVVVYEPPDGTAPLEVATTFYSTTNGGYTAANDEPRKESVPYLIAKPDPFDEALDANGEPQNPYHSWERSYTSEQISGWLADYPFADLNVGELQQIRISREGPSGRIDDALVTLVGSERTIEVRDDDGKPFGYRFYYSLVRGCRSTEECRTLLSTKLTVSDDATTAPTAPPNRPLPFTDVDAEAPYASAVRWLYNAEITRGTTETTFSPQGSVNRGDFAAFLWRFAGKPDAADGSAVMSDVPSDSHFARAVSWMLGRGITVGCSEDRTMFCPEANLSAADVTTFLWRFAGRKYSDFAIPYQDVHVNAYYLEPARWATEFQIWVDSDYEPSDAESTSFGPDDDVDRARMAMLLWRLAAQPSAFASPSLVPSLPRPS